ncbi:retention module-containing protein [Campylobacter concisus]|uniref:retention module-containing protein n=1 Tax=Campylobacter concisus TaxID=199 RepID=UPI00188449B0|nr:retention module-containing protein [Campylobacter concisus]MBE9851036.1 retention module-containing protein [Campylobacter concisus]
MQKLGVIKNILGGEIVAVDKSGNERVLKVGDSIFEGETIKANGSAKAVIAANDGKEVSLQNGESLSLDKEANALSDNPEIASIQKALLNGANITDLEETAAGGNQGGGNATGDGVSLGAASFAEGGHYSNINENYRNLTDANRAFQTPENSIGGYNDAGTDADTTTPISPVTPVTPSTPSTPPTPSTPVTPVTPSTPSTPPTPPTPSTPSTPGVTVTPGTPSPANPPVIPPHPGAVEVTTSMDPANSEVRESGAGANGEGGHYLVYKLGLSGTPVSPSGETTDLALNFIGGTRGEDYANLIEYSLNNGAAGSWVTLNTNNTIPGVNVEDISKVQVRIKVLDDDGQDTTKGPLHHNQNEGDNTGPQGMTIDNVQKTDMVDNFAVFKESVKLSVTPSSRYLLPTTNANMAEGKIIDNDDNIELNKDIKGNIANHTNLNTNDGDDTVSIKANLENLHLDTGSGNDVVNFDKEVTISGTKNTASVGGVLGHYNSTTINLGRGDDVVNINADLTIFKANINLGAYTPSSSNSAHDEAGNNTLNINANILGKETFKVIDPSIHNSWYNDNQIHTGDGDDVVNVKDGVRIERVNILMDTGSNTFKANNITMTDAWVDTSDRYSEARDVNTMEISNSTLTNVNLNRESQDAVLGYQSLKLDNNKGESVTAYAKDLLEVKGNNDGNSHYETGSFSSAHVIADGISIGQAGFSNKTGVDFTADISNLTAKTRVWVTSYGESNDTINFKGNNILNNLEDSSSADIDTRGGNDTINFEGKNVAGAITINTDAGNDTINIGSETKFGGTHEKYGYKSVQFSSINMGDGDDTISIDKGAELKSTTIKMGDGDDVVNLNGSLKHAGGTYWDGSSTIDLGNGNDIIHIGKDAEINADGWTTSGGIGHKEHKGIVIQGGAGTDTLDLAGNIDFSKVAGFEKITLGGSENNVTLNLTINDVLNITNGNGANRTLRIDGESGDHVHMSSDFGPGVSSGGYTTFTATSGTNTFTIEVKDEIIS